MSSRSASPVQSRSKKYSLWPVVLLCVLINLYGRLYVLPVTRVIERRLCRDYYSRHHSPGLSPDGSIPERLCKIDEVQKQLAWIGGIMDTTYIVCDLVVTIPFSFIAERYGVRIVLWCNLVPKLFLPAWALAVGIFENALPIKAILVGPFFAVLGGECVLQSTLFALTSSLAKDSVQRASYFSYVSSVSYVISFIGPSLASFTMSQNLWLPFYLGIALLLLAIPVIAILPETYKSDIALTSGPEEGTLEENSPLFTERSQTPNKYANAFEPSTGLFQSTLHAARKLVRLVKGRRNFQILLVSFFLTALASSDTTLLVQYISKRYDWTFAEAGYLLSAKALVNVVLLTVVVPRIVQSSTSTRAAHSSDIRLHYLGAQVSIAISVVGVLLVAFAFDIWMLLAALIVYAMGSALPIFTLSIVKSPSIALPDSDIQDLSIVMLIRMLGSLVGVPLVTGLWVQGIKIGGAGLGLPYFVSASVYLVAASVITRLQF